MTQPASNTATTPDWAELGAVLVIIPTSVSYTHLRFGRFIRT